MREQERERESERENTKLIKQRSLSNIPCECMKTEEISNTFSSRNKFTFLLFAVLLHPKDYKNGIKTKGKKKIIIEYGNTFTDKFFLNGCFLQLCYLTYLKR